MIVLQETIEVLQYQNKANVQRSYAMEGAKEYLRIKLLEHKNFRKETVNANF